MKRGTATFTNRPPADPAVLGVIAVGGALGSLARYGLGRAWPDAHHVIPWTTFGINVSGSLLLGMLVVAVTELWRAPRLVRPALGTGVLGGFTTFSTFAVQDRGLSIGPAVTYLAISAVGGILAAAAGMTLMRRLNRRTPRTTSLDPDLP